MPELMSERAPRLALMGQSDKAPPMDPGSRRGTVALPPAETRDPVPLPRRGIDRPQAS